MKSMKKYTKRFAGCAFILLVSLFCSARGDLTTPNSSGATPAGGPPSSSYGGKKEGGPPLIRCQPESQTVYVGSNAVFMVQAESPGSPFHNAPLTYQWERQGPMETEFTKIASQTDSSYIIPSVSTNGPDGPAFFRVTVSSTNGSAISEPVSLLVWTTNSPLTVFGSPYPQNHTGGTCPGSYVARVDYTKSASQGYGWHADHSNSNTNHVGSDDRRTDTKVEVSGLADDYWCAGHSGSNTHPGHPAPEDSWEVFTIYFPTTGPGTNSYPITLTGYLP